MTDNEDSLEPLIKDLLANADLIESLLTLLKKMKQAGLVELLNSVSSGYVPTDIEFMGKFFSSKELIYGMLKSANTAVSLIHALSDERTSDMVKAIMYNLPDATESMVDAAKNPDRLSALKLMSMLKDPEVAAGMSVMFSFLKFLGSAIKKVD
ncbi:MAG: DUF1641 domain-containing protein [Thermoplasmataceae archaeon]